MYFDCSPTTRYSSTGKANATGSEVTSAIKPINVGPPKYAAIAINPIRANPTDGAIPGIDAAAKLKAGKNGPIPKPAAAKPAQTIIKPDVWWDSDNGTPTSNPIPHNHPPKYPPYLTVFTWPHFSKARSPNKRLTIMASENVVAAAAFKPLPIPMWSCRRIPLHS